MMPDGEYWEGRVPCIVDPRATSFKVWEFPDRLVLAEPERFEHIPFNEGFDAIPVVEEREISFTVDKEGTLEGLVVHIQLELDQETRLTSRCSGSHWANVFVMLGTETEVLVGDLIRIKTITDLDRPTPEYTFEVQVEQNGQVGAPARVTTH